MNSPQSAQAQASLNSILDSTLDDLADAPTFAPYPAGAHKVIFDFESKVINNKPAVEIKFTGIETVEPSDPEGAVITEGQQTNILLLLRNNDGSKNEISEGKLKMICKALAENFPGNSPGEILTNAKGAEVLAVTKVRKNKQSGDQNTDIVALSVL